MCIFPLLPRKTKPIQKQSFLSVFFKKERKVLINLHQITYNINLHNIFIKTKSIKKLLEKKIFICFPKFFILLKNKTNL